MKNKHRVVNIILGVIFVAYIILMCKILFFKYIPLSEIFKPDREVIRSVNNVEKETLK